MKTRFRIVTWITLVMAFTVLAGCGFGGGPASTASNFLRDLERGNIDSAKDYFAADVRANFSSKLTPAMTQASREITERGGIDSIKVTKEEINGELADVALEVTYGDGTSKTEQFKMIKEDGEWKFTISK